MACRKKLGQQKYQINIIAGKLNRSFETLGISM